MQRLEQESSKDLTPGGETAFISLYLKAEKKPQEAGLFKQVGPSPTVSDHK
jgi:hypothetical protein